ncbi:MAG: NAD(P)-binding protein, partial [Methanoregulaceae archaeon]
MRISIPVNTVILGGGLTGITLARQLHQAGERVHVLEAEETTGGLCRSRQEAGFTFDTGGSHI